MKPMTPDPRSCIVSHNQDGLFMDSMSHYTKACFEPLQPFAYVMANMFRIVCPTAYSDYSALVLKV